MLWGGILFPGEIVAVPAAQHVHVFVARGTARLGDGDELQAGDAARLTDEPSLALTAGPAKTELLVWATA